MALEELKGLKDLSEFKDLRSPEREEMAEFLERIDFKADEKEY